MKRRRSRPRCVALTGDNGEVIGFAYMRGGALTDADRTAVATFEQVLRDVYQELHTMTQPDQTHPAPAPAEVDLTAAGVAGWYEILRKMRAEKARIEEVEAQARAAIEAALGDAVDGTIDGRPVVRWHHTAAPRRFDKKRFEKAHPDLVSEFTVVGQPGRRFEIVEPKADA